MLDKDFELAAIEHLARIRAERLDLFSDAGYFARWRELIADKKHDEAWFQVESEFFEAYRCRRFLSFSSFRMAQNREARRRESGEKAKYVRVYTDVT